MHLLPNSRKINGRCVPTYISAGISKAGRFHKWLDFAYYQSAIASVKPAGEDHSKRVETSPIGLFF
jgi:hypothetical protein